MQLHQIYQKRTFERLGSANLPPRIIMAESESGSRSPSRSYDPIQVRTQPVGGFCALRVTAER